jgi:YD repeat-containing protein
MGFLVKTKTPTIKASDYATVPNISSRSWSVNVTSDPARSLSYDLNGNCLGDGLRSYQWDGENRLVKITKGSNINEFGYDGLSRRTSEKLNGVMIRRWLWDGQAIAEERDPAGTAVRRRYFPQGEQRLGGSDAGNYYYTRDHLGSVREVTDSSAAVRSRYDYEPYGKRTFASG